MSFCKLQNSHDHNHSIGHHRLLKKLKGSSFTHECYACGTNYKGVKKYRLHISTIEHKAKMKKLVISKKKPPPLEKYLDKETLAKILKQNKAQRLLEKKVKNKKKKAELKEALKCADGGVSTTPKPPNQKQQIQAKQKNTPKQPKKPASKQPQQNVQNKEHRLGWQLPGQQAAPQQQTGARPSQSEWRSYNVQNVQSASSQKESCDVPMMAPDQSTWSNSGQVGYSSSYNSGTDNTFTSDSSPQTGATVFEKHKCMTQESGADLPRTRGSLSRLKGSPPHSPAPTQDEGTGPIRGEDVHKMLSNVRKALQMEKGGGASCAAQGRSPSGGVEPSGLLVPSRQEKEGEAGKRTELDTPAHGSAASVSRLASLSASIQSQQVSASDLAPPKGVRPSQQADKTAQGKTPKKATDGIDSELLMVSANGPWSQEGESQEGESQEGPSMPRPPTLALPASLSRHMSKAGPTAEPNLNAARRVRTVGGRRKSEGEKEAGLKPTLQKLLTSAGSQRKVNWREMYQEANRKKQEKVKGMPRFGIELVGPLSQPDDFPAYEDGDLPLTEGFHWESTQLDHPPSPPAPHSQATPAPERPSESPLPGVERPRASPVSLKAEPRWDGTGPGGSDRTAGDGQGERKVEKKRKQDRESPGVSSLNPSGKKLKVKSKNDQVKVDQLLAVSLKEEELCRSMQTVDSSLIQARNALQAAYSEVQRLLLVKQQVTEEINGLRAQRIEILQGMQGGQNPLPHPVSSPFTSAILPPTVPSPPVPSLTASLRPLTPVHPSPPPMPSPSPHLLAPAIPNPLAISNQAIKQEAALSHSLPAVPPPSQQRAVSSAPVAAPPPSVSLSKPPERQKRVKLEAQSRMSDSSSTASDSEEDEEEPGKMAEEDDDCSIKVVENAEAVVEIEDSDVEDADPAGHASSHHGHAPSHHPPVTPQHGSAPPPDSLEAGLVDVSSSYTQTFVPPTHIKGVRIKEDPQDRERPAEPPEDEEPSVGSFLGHTGPVHGLQIHGGLLYTCSGDKTARAYSLLTRECQAVYVGHTSKINCLLVSSPPRLPARLYTGSSDETVRCFSIKSQKCLDQLSLPDRVLCLHMAWNILYVGLANGYVVSFDIKTLRQLDVFECHVPRGISCLASCQEGARRVLLVGSYDSTISVRDAKSSLLLRTLQGHSKTVLCSKVVNDLVFSGSSDTSVHAHNIHTGELVRIYKGHSHAVTAVEVLGKVMVTACLDKLVRVYELQSHDRLQVYGGHSNMVMCMAVHKSVIYTGCYDGTVQAVKLNLMENYRCWWHGCSLIFGVKDHLLQHLLSDHSNAQQPTLKCRWRDCDAFFNAKNAPKAGHMQNHVDTDSKLDS